MERRFATAVFKSRRLQTASPCSKGNKRSKSEDALEMHRPTPRSFRDPIEISSSSRLCLLDSGLVLMSAKFEIAIRKNLQGLGYAL